MYLTWIGRVAFPCYAFLLAEGFLFVFKDKKRYLKHISTLIFLAVISEPCYDMLDFGAEFTTKFMESQSVIITLLLWFLWMSATELLIPSNKEKNSKTTRKEILILIFAYILIAFSNYKMDANFNLMWPLLIIWFYWYLRYSRNEEKTKNKWNWIKRFWALLGIFIIYIPLYFWIRSWFADVTTWLWQMKEYLPWIGGLILSALILSLSNCKLWYHKKRFKYVYTLFYPVHALIIGLILIFG